MPDPAVIYAVNDSLRYLLMVRRSIESLRKYNRRIPIHLYLFGKSNSIDLSFLDDLHVSLIPRPVISLDSAVFLKPGLLLKWYAIKDSPGDSLLFLDADTHVFGDVQRLLDHHEESHFYARAEVGMTNKPTMVGNAFVPSLLDSSDKLKQLYRKYRARQFPIFNTGVMVFNHGLQKKIAQRFHLFEEVARYCQQNSNQNPLGGLVLMEELAASIILGRIPNIRARCLEKKMAPFYIEFKGNDVPGPGIVVHTWSSYYRHLVKDLERPLDQIKKSRADTDMPRLWKSWRKKSRPRSKRGVPQWEFIVVDFNKADFYRRYVNRLAVDCLRKEHPNLNIQLAPLENGNPLEILKGFLTADLVNRKIVLLSPTCRFLGDIEGIARRINSREVLGRVYPGTEEQFEPLMGNDLIDRAFNFQQMKKEFNKLGLRNLTVLDCNVLIFGSNVLKTVEEHWNYVERKITQLSKREVILNLRGEKVYPSLILSVAFGLVGEIRLRPVKANKITFYQELKAGLVNRPGSFVSTDFSYFPYFHREYYGRYLPGAKVD